MKNLGPCWIWPILWASSIFVTSSGVVTVGQLSHAVYGVSGGRVSETGFRSFWHLAWWLFVKGWHACEFGILFLLIRRAMPRFSYWALALPVLYAFADEAHQLFVPERGCRLSDVCIDCLGICAAYLLRAWLVTRLRGNVDEAPSAVRRVASKPALSMLAAAILLSLVFLLSVHPFGLITLDRAGERIAQPRP